jgi:tRNA pseudouridine32 synthase/23S rRNA pseudouridine746 synthase
MHSLFENSSVIVVDKPAGVLTVPGRFGDQPDSPSLGRRLEQQLGQRLWPVHRLDHEVSGLVLFARSAEAHRVANAAFEGRRVDKQYQALTEGAVLIPFCPSNFTWNSLLVRGKKRAFEAPHGKPAVTRAQALARVPAGPWLAPGSAVPTPPQLLHFRLSPETGRPHQLRVHLARAGFAVVGDALYGAKTLFFQPGAIALRSVRLAFEAEDQATLGLPGPIEVLGFEVPPASEAVTA